jgi:hypothetical protein
LEDLLKRPQKNLWPLQFAHRFQKYLSGVSNDLNVQQVLFKTFSIDELLVSIFPPEGSTDMAGQMPGPEAETRPYPRDRHAAA